jgi:hypothetical protein
VEAKDEAILGVGVVVGWHLKGVLPAANVLDAAGGRGLAATRGAGGDEVDGRGGQDGEGRLAKGDHGDVLLIYYYRRRQ